MKKRKGQRGKDCEKKYFIIRRYDGYDSEDDV